jgi:acetyl-CoA carboxylase biotin carboxyl carrier protein
MAENSSGPTEPLDVRRIHFLAHLMKRYDLSSLDLADGQVQIRLRRRGPDIASLAPASIPQSTTGPYPAPLPSVTPAAHGPGETAPSTAAQTDKTVVIESPMVGTYYTSRAPDAPPLVTAGTVVHPGTVVGIIEAMKVFTDIPAGVSGTIVEVLVKNGQAVEYGQPLFRVKPS